ncbi:MAG: FAD-dependent oxidoreductase [Gammaproteobacteria bacterium]|nr:FAD-dependent oxidoreductase [Gammaproteobacteria bacterium]
MNSENCIIVGASHAGTTLALQLRRAGWQGAIHLVSNENELPYQRPPLSKDLLAGTKELEQILLRPQKLYEDNDINLLLGTEVMSIDPAAREVELSNNAVMAYNTLALCTGARARRIALGEGIENLFYIRTARDVLELKSKVRVGKKAVIIGGGYIGLETAAVLATSGMDVVVLEMAERILQRVTGELMSSFISELHHKHNVRIETFTNIVSITEDGGTVNLVCDGGDTYQGDVVIVGVGIEPNIKLAETAGVELDNGIQVNEFLQTSNAHIYAAGDCVNHYSPLYQRRIRLESVQNATDQAKTVAANICGQRQVYDSLPWFWSDQYNIKLQMAGLNTDYDKLVLRGSVDKAETKGFALFYLNQERLIAADCVNRPKEFMVSKQLIKEGAQVRPNVLADESIEPAEFGAK